MNLNATLASVSQDVSLDLSFIKLGQTWQARNFGCIAK